MYQMSRHILIVLLLLFFAFETHSQLVVNEVLASNTSVLADEDGDYEDWIELYNHGVDSIDLSAYGLSDNMSQPFKWLFPKVTIAPGEFLLVWASGKDRVLPDAPLHTNFKVSVQGEPIVLSHPDGSMVDFTSAVAMATDVSYGRSPDGTGAWFFYYAPTPGYANFTAPFAGLITPPFISQGSGFYSEPFDLSISHDNPEAVIVYTLDGSEPSLKNLTGRYYNYRNEYAHFPGQNTGPLNSASYTSHAYTEAIFISDRSAEENTLSGISSTNANWPDYFPNSPVKKGTVLRAAAYVNGVRSEVVTRTYFVSDSDVFNHALPVVSLSINEDDLFDHEQGIYVAGIDFDDWRSANPLDSVYGGSPANYERRGSDAEKSAVFQYFVNGDEVINQNVGVRIHGGWTRTVQNKSLRLYPRSIYDNNTSFNYPFFGAIDAHEFKRIVLRNSGSDYNSTYFRDAFIQAAVGHLRFDTQAYQSVVLYVNGEYFGMLNMRERYDKFYFERMYGISADELDLVSDSAGVNEGDLFHCLAMRDFVFKNDLSIHSNFEYLNTLLDGDNFLDYNITQIYIDNTDWPGTNNRSFRKRTSQFDPNAPYAHDGRWRWLLFDTDFGLGLLNPNNYEHNTLAFATSPVQDHYANPEWATVLLRKMLENEKFEVQFINRFADLINTAFLPERMEGIMDSLSAKIQSEQLAHQGRWNSLQNWTQDIETMRQFVNLRPSYQREHIREYFGLGESYNLKLEVSDSDQGYIRLNSIDIVSSTPGVAQQAYPWSGIYYSDVPVSLTAVALPGYRFVRWEGDVELSDATFQQVFDKGDVRLVAVFEEFDGKNTGEEAMYYWHFNALSDEFDVIVADELQHYLDGASIKYVGSGPGYMDAVGDGSSLNLRYDEISGVGLRVRNPSIARSLLIEASTARFKDIKLSYATKRTSNGATKQTIFYRTGAGQLFKPFTSISPAAEYELYTFDFTSVPGVNNNPHFAVRIDFGGGFATGADGNNRFDNISFDGVEVDVQDCISLSKLELDSYADCDGLSLDLAPNPATGYTFVSFSNPFENIALLEVYDLNGRLVTNLFHQSTVAQQLYRLQFDTSSLPGGVYLLKLTTDADLAVRRLVVR